MLEQCVDAHIFQDATSDPHIFQDATSECEESSHEQESDEYKDDTDGVEHCNLSCPRHVMNYPNMRRHDCPRICTYHA